jgi:iron complex outermembrane recepter protein
VTVDYFHITVDDAIGVTGTANILNGCYVNGIDDYCNQIVRNNAGRIQFVNDFYTNVGQTKTAGIDFSVRYALPTEVGRFSFGFDGSWLAFYDVTTHVKGGDVTINAKDTYDAGSYGALPPFKATSGLDWYLGGAQVGLLAHYVSSFDECSSPFDQTTAQGGICGLGNNNPLGPTNPFRRRVSHFFQLDMHAGYTLPNTLGRTSFFFGINNLFDEAPPYIYSAALANSDPSTYDYVGRYVYGRIQHRF